MKFFFEAWKKKRYVNSDGAIIDFGYSTTFTVDGVPFTALMEFATKVIFVFSERDAVAMIPNEYPSGGTEFAEAFIKNHFASAFHLVKLIQSKKKLMEETQ